MALNSTNFPDDNFRSYLYYNFDSDRDNYIDANEVEELRIYDQEISTLKGIEFFQIWRCWPAEEITSRVWI